MIASREQKNFDVSVADTNGNTNLHYAVRSESEKVVRAFIKCTRKAFEKDNLRALTLYQVPSPVATLQYPCHTPTQALNNEGRTAYDLCISWDFTGVVRTLLADEAHRLRRRVLMGTSHSLGARSLSLGRRVLRRLASSESLTFDNLSEDTNSEVSVADILS